jgi:hypothetical protein
MLTVVEKVVLVEEGLDTGCEDAYPYFTRGFDEGNGA